MIQPVSFSGNFFKTHFNKKVKKSSPDAAAAAPKKQKVSDKAIRQAAATLAALNLIAVPASSYAAIAKFEDPNSPTGYRIESVVTPVDGCYVNEQNNVSDCTITVLEPAVQSDTVCPDEEFVEPDLPLAPPPIPDAPRGPLEGYERLYDPHIGYNPEYPDQTVYYVDSRIHPDRADADDMSVKSEDDYINKVFSNIVYKRHLNDVVSDFSSRLETADGDYKARLEKDLEDAKYVEKHLNYASEGINYNYECMSDDKKTDNGKYFHQIMNVALALEDEGSTIYDYGFGEVEKAFYEDYQHSFLAGFGDSNVEERAAWDAIHGEMIPNLIADKPNFSIKTQNLIDELANSEYTTERPPVHLHVPPKHEDPVCPDPEPIPDDPSLPEKLEPNAPKKELVTEFERPARPIEPNLIPDEPLNQIKDIYSSIQDDGYTGEEFGFEDIQGLYNLLADTTHGFSGSLKLLEAKTVTWDVIHNKMIPNLEKYENTGAFSEETQTLINDFVNSSYVDEERPRIILPPYNPDTCFPLTLREEKEHLQKLNFEDYLDMTPTWDYYDSLSESELDEDEEYYLSLRQAHIPHKPEVEEPGEEAVHIEEIQIDDTDVDDVSQEIEFIPIL